MAPSRDANPSAYQEVFVNELRARREASGLSRNRLAAALGCTPQWIAKVETYEKPPSEGLADDLDTYFQTGGMFHRLWERHVVARKEGLVPSGFRPLIEAEKNTREMSIYEPLLIPGLFQTEDHARLVLGAGLRPEKADELVAIRMDRQSLLTQDDPPWVFLMIREAVIRDLHPEVRIGQCKRLLELMGELHISIQLIPTQAKVFHESGFQVLSYKRLPDVAYVDGAGGYGQMLTDVYDVRRLTLLFNVIRSAALSAADSEDLIREIMEDM
ncbi:helix-turn-helix domain-containing protein [Actinomadura decatromicini]|uniref:Helix-turn-helix domain-containing protein n=1 Tax=Actinomadura decatromicini TaxID=2604572 RepID=A0A5D3FQ14_9ACTN|nr:helix-turn-helix transcriptional regulator [Actinomadura decatromicini]TYK49195.1 helix-turn-helix domain-containing protein [Actinomadura decatromicini]